MTDSKPMQTPMDENAALQIVADAESFDATLYCQTVGCLIYLCNTRPDIQFVVSQVSRFMQNPTMLHWKVVKRIFRYLKGTSNYAMVFSKSTHLLLKGFSDSDWEGDRNTRRSTSGFCFYLGDCLISWLSKRQPTIATSSCEAESRAAFTATLELVWLQKIFSYLDVRVHKPIQIFSDSESAIAIANNLVHHARTKHIEIHYHYIREQLAKKHIELVYVPSSENVADIFTKALTRDNHEKMCRLLKLVPI
ncbi:hypothetical protein KP509_12G092900 [Ceratopteris richardii]|uniref:Uncharacterized protein n=1 Tax=Ceratopteris richardii TaxID=49495 RepID=A0A8T2TQU4_CERRI|nr:hypothetical protein KP509_12G092900 [Ceratopteris richardii]